MEARITVLGGDGIGPEVVAQGMKVLRQVAEVYGHRFKFVEALIGGIAIDETGQPLPGETLARCREGDAVLLGAVGGPKWDDPLASVRPEQGLLGLRKELGLFANMRPVKLFSPLLHASPVRPEIVEGVDLVVVRELTGGIYFGKPSGRQEVDGQEQAVDSMVYTASEVERVVRVACELARKRRGKVSSVDKANVLSCSRLWRDVATRVFEEYPDLETEHVLVDACSMFLIKRPTTFDVIVTGNMFGDILTDEASMLAGSMGMLPSAALSEDRLGLYEPIHGSAPKYTGQNVVNPIATILSCAMLLRYSLGLDQEAVAVENAVAAVLDEGYRTRDIREEGKPQVGTTEMGDLIAARIV
jgi:3-isopropylmalate dehydrogenase